MRTPDVYRGEYLAGCVHHVRRAESGRDVAVGRGGAATLHNASRSDGMPAPSWCADTRPSATTRGTSSGYARRGRRARSWSRWSSYARRNGRAAEATRPTSRAHGGPVLGLARGRVRAHCLVTRWHRAGAQPGASWCRRLRRARRSSAFAKLSWGRSDRRFQLASRWTVARTEAGDLPVGRYGIWPRSSTLTVPAVHGLAPTATSCSEGLLDAPGEIKHA